MNQFQIPVVCLIVVISLDIMFVRRRNLPLTSARFFRCLLFFMTLHMVLEIVQSVVECFFFELNSIPDKILQQLCLATLLTAIYALFMYIWTRVWDERNNSAKGIFIKNVPLVIGYAAILLIPGVRRISESGSVWHAGLVVEVTYYICFIYMIAGIALAVIHSQQFQAGENRVIIIGISIWLISSGIAARYVEVPIPKVGSMLMMLFIYISSENPREYMKKNMQFVMNRYALVQVLMEIYRKNEDNYVLLFTLTERTGKLYGTERMYLRERLDRIAAFISQKIRENIYMLNDQSLCLIVKTEEEVDRFQNLIMVNPDESLQNTKHTLAVLDIPTYADDFEMALRVLDYVSMEYVYKRAEEAIQIDDYIVDKMLYRAKVEDVVREATERREFEVYYQPIFSVKDDRVISAEALVRLRNHEELGFISPEVFIPIAEEMGLVQKIDDLVFDEVCGFYLRGNLREFGIQFIEVNLSGNEIMDPGTAKRLRQHMAEHKISPSNISFEITETAYINDDGTALQNMNALQDIGSRFALDDFGSGYSNLNEILKMKFQIIKLDKEFVWNCLDPEKPENLKMLDFCVSFMQGYGMQVLAEGVEDERQVKILTDHGVEYLQGYHFSKPIPEKEFLEYLEEQE